MAGNGSAPLQGEALIDDDLISTDEERVIVNLRKQIRKLTGDLEAGTSAFEEARRNYNGGVVTAQEQLLLENIARTNGELSKLSKLEKEMADRKIEENSLGGQVNELMLEVKALIRKWQEVVARIRNIIDAPLEGGMMTRQREDFYKATGDLLNKLSRLSLQNSEEEG